MLVAQSSALIAHRLALVEAHVSENRLALIARHRADMALNATQERLANPDLEVEPPAPSAVVDKRV